MGARATLADAPEPFAAPGAFPPARVGWTAVGVLLLLYGLAFIDRQVIALMVGDLKRDLSITDFQVSLLQGFAFALLYALLGLPLGFAADRMSRRKVICFGVLVWAIAAMSCGLARTFPQLLAARTLVGAGEAALAPAAYSMLSDLFPKRRLTAALSIYAIGATLGSEGSIALSGLILSAAKGGVDAPVLGHIAAWRFAFLVTGAPGLLLAFSIFAIPEPARRFTHGRATTWGDVFGFMKSRGRFFASHLIGFSAVMAMAYARLSWTPTFLTRRFHWPIGEVGVVLGAFGVVTGVVAFLITGPLVDHLYRRGVRDAHFRVYVAGSLLLLLGGVGAFLAPSIPLVFAGLTVIAFPLNLAAIAASAIQLVTPPELRGRISAIYLMVVGLFGMTLGPSLVGLFTDAVFHDPAKLHLSLAAAYLVLAPIAVAAFALGLRPMRESVEAEDAAPAPVTIPGSAGTAG